MSGFCSIPSYKIKSDRRQIYSAFRSFKMKPIYSIMRDVADPVIAMNKYYRICIIILFCWFFLISFFFPATATTIIALRTSNELFLAADSLNNRVVGPSSLACKIMQVQNVFITFSGRISSDGPVQFDIRDIARHVFSRNRTIQEKITIFNTIVKRNLKQLVNQDRQNKEWFNKFYYANKDRVITCIIIAVASDSYPVFYALQYVVASSADQPADIKEMFLPYNFPTKNKTYDLVLGGVFDAFIKDLPKQPLPSSFNAIKNIKRWITKETKIAPDKVSLPIDILRITPGHAEWIQHKPECPEIIDTFNH